MKFFVGITKKELLDYVRLEEDEDTAELLMKSSFLYVDQTVVDGKKIHYWSYPVSCGVAWVSFSPTDDLLSTEADEDVPQAIKSATAPRDKHPIRKIQERPAIQVDRSPVSAPKWVPMKNAPSLCYFPMYHENISIEQSAKAFSAKTSRADIGINLWVRYFCVKLTTKRYAIIEAREENKQQISIELEVEETNKNYPMGYVYVSDLKEILGILGRECELPLKKCQYHWKD